LPVPSQVIDIVDVDGIHESGECLSEAQSLPSFIEINAKLIELSCRHTD